MGQLHAADFAHPVLFVALLLHVAPLPVAARISVAVVEAHGGLKSSGSCGTCISPDRVTDSLGRSHLELLGALQDLSILLASLGRRLLGGQPPRQAPALESVLTNGSWILGLSLMSK